MLARSQDHPRTAHYSTTKLVTNSARFLTRHQNGMWMEWMGRWVSGSVDRWVGGLVGRWVDGSVGRCISRSVDQWISRSMDQWISRVQYIFRGLLFVENLSPH